MTHQPTDEELLQETRILRNARSDAKTPPLRHDVPLRSTLSVIDGLRSSPVLDTTNDIYGILLSLNAVSAYAVKAAAEHPLFVVHGGHISGLAMECRSVLDAVQSALPLLFQSTGRPAYTVETPEVAELRGRDGWLVGLDDEHAEPYALAWFARLIALLMEKLEAVLHWAKERELRTPAHVVEPLIERIQSLHRALTNAVAADQSSSEAQRPTERLRNRP
jgi:hypothetical protein